MERETTTCTKNFGNGRICGKVVYIDELGVNKYSRTGALKAALCARCRKSKQDASDRQRGNPSAATMARVQRANMKRCGSSARKAETCRYKNRKMAPGTSMHAHDLVHQALNHILRDNQGGGRFFDVNSSFHSTAEVRLFFHRKSSALGFEGGLDDRGNGANKWTVGHIIPKYAYNGLDADELRKCWDTRNMTCITKSQNSAQGRDFDDSLVPPDLYPADWNRLPCTPARRAEILARFAHQDQPPSQ
jgi:hypothetical protein